MEVEAVVDMVTEVEYDVVEIAMVSDADGFALAVTLLLVLVYMNPVEINVQEIFGDESTDIVRDMALEDVDTESEDGLEPVYEELYTVYEVGPRELGVLEAELVILASVGSCVPKSGDVELTTLPYDTVDVREPSEAGTFNIEDEGADASTDVGDAVALFSSHDFGIEGVMSHSVETKE